jgi:hypothetical protein
MMMSSSKTCSTYTFVSLVFIGELDADNTLFVVVTKLPTHNNSNNINNRNNRNKLPASKKNHNKCHNNNMNLLLKMDT